VIDFLPLVSYTHFSKDFPHMVSICDGSLWSKREPTSISVRIRKGGHRAIVRVFQLIYTEALMSILRTSLVIMLRDSRQSTNRVTRTEQRSEQGLLIEVGMPLADLEVRGP
jgi:hypothetical protein